VCVDDHQDLSVDQKTLVAPPVPAPWVDLYRATLQSKGDRLHGTFQLGATPLEAADPEYLVFVGLPGTTPGAFEIHVKKSASGWIAELHSGTGLADIQAVAGAQVGVSGSTVTFDAPLNGVPMIRPDQPISYGATAKVVDTKGRQLTKSGSLTSDDASTAQVIDLCSPIK
jgi:hypothetical protein